MHLQAISTMVGSKRGRGRGSGDDAASGATKKKSRAVDDDLVQAEEQEYQDLLEIARSATVVEFDPCTGLPLCPSFLPADTFSPIQGIAKKRLPQDLLDKLSRIHEHAKNEVEEQVQWAGTGEDTKRTRCFAMPSQAALDRLDNSAVRLHAPEKTGEDAKADEEANRRAVTVLEGENEQLGAKVARDFVDAIDPERAGLSTNVLTAENLVAYQPNLHNGARHLAAHLDWPLHEGFGKVICTVAIKGSATILLIARDVDVATECQPAWRFHLNQGECYVLSGLARNRCLHAVIADEAETESGEEEKRCERESLNLRFGLHTVEEAEKVTSYWEDDL